MLAMIHLRYTDRIRKVSAMVQHLGRAVRATRAFFILRDRQDPAQPQIVACHPPLSDDALLRVLRAENFVCTPVIDDEGQQAWIGISSEGSMENRELAQEMATVCAQSIATELRSLSLEGSEGCSRDRNTGLPDREAFLSRLDDALTAAHDDASHQIAVLVVDLDRFHRVCARFGEAGGEVLIHAVAERLEDAVADAKVLVARIGPDRFALLYKEGAHAEVLAGADRIHEYLKLPFQIKAEQIFITASIGVAYSASHGSANDLVRDADLAIAQINSQGGGTTLVFRAGMHNSAAFQLLRERDVRLAVSRNEFILHFQPIVGAMRGGLHAFDALLRWRNPEEGLLPPSTFLDVLNETGLIDVVGRRVIRDACTHAARWMALSGTLVPVSVNIVPLQLYAPGFCEEVARVLATAGLPPEGLILELTENALIDDAAMAHRVLDQLRTLGVKVFIDDFGTGYSSLSYLHDLPVTGIKLDRTFLRSIETSEKQREIVRTIVRLAHFMEMEVVAEGIEQPHQLNAVRDLECDFAQGFCFSRPFDAEHATRYLARQLARGNAA